MSKLQLEVRIIPPSVRELEDQILAQSCLIPREPVQNPNSSFSMSLQPTTVSPQPLYQYPINLHPNVVRFVHLTLFSNTLDHIAEEISQRFLKLHPEQEPLEIERLENSFGTDLDPDYVAEDIFNRDNLIRVIVGREIVTKKRSQSPQSPYNSLVLPRKRAKSSSLKTPNTTLQSPSRHPLAEEINANSTTVFANVDPTKPNSPATHSSPVILNNSTRKVSERITSGMLSADMPNLSTNDISPIEEGSFQKENQLKQVSVPSKETVQMIKKANVKENKSATTSPSKRSNNRVTEKSPSPTGENTVTLTKEDVFRFFKSGLRNSAVNDTDLEDTFSSYKPTGFNSAGHNGSALNVDEASPSKNYQNSELDSDTTRPRNISSPATEPSAPKIATPLASTSKQIDNSVHSNPESISAGNSSMAKDQREESRENSVQTLSKEEWSKQKTEDEINRKLQAEERRRALEEKRRLQHEEKIKKEEERRRAREERERTRLEKKAQQEEEKRKKQEERKKQQEERKKQLEEEKQRKLEEKNKLLEKKRLEEIERAGNPQLSVTTPKKQNTGVVNAINSSTKSTTHNLTSSPVTNEGRLSSDQVSMEDKIASSPVRKNAADKGLKLLPGKLVANESGSSLASESKKNDASVVSSTDKSIPVSQLAVKGTLTSHTNASPEKSNNTKKPSHSDRKESSSESDSDSDSSDDSDSDSDSDSSSETGSSGSEDSRSEEESSERKPGTVSKKPIVVDTPTAKSLVSPNKQTSQDGALKKPLQVQKPVSNQSSPSSALASKKAAPVERKEPTLTGVSSLPKLTQLMERGVPAVKDTTASASTPNKRKRIVKSDALVDDSDSNSGSSSDSSSSSSSGSDSESSSDSDSASSSNASSDSSSDSESESDGNKALSSQFLDSKKAKELIRKKKKGSALSSLLKDTRK